MKSLTRIGKKGVPIGVFLTIILFSLVTLTPNTAANPSNGWNLPRQFSGTQGTNNWYYYSATNPPDFYALTYDNYVNPWGTQTFYSWNSPESRYMEICGRDSGDWHNPGQGAWLQPGEYNHNDISMAWRAPQTGTVYIRAMLQTAYPNADSSYGNDDGVYFSIYRGTTLMTGPSRVFRGNNEGNRLDNVVFLTSVSVTAGEYLHFYVDRGSWQDADGMYYSYTVSYDSDVDRSAPTTTYSFSGNTLTLSATDSGGSGLSHIEYLKYSPTSGSWTRYTGPITVAAGQKFMIRSIDNMGNVEAYQRIMVNLYSPVAEADGPYTCNEGSSVTFNAGGSNDPDGNPLQYRWDFTDDGSWDTSFSSSPTATSPTWADEATGTARVQVFDGIFYSTDTCTYTVSNAAPNAMLLGGVAVMGNFIIVTNTGAQSFYTTITGDIFTTPLAVDNKGYSCYGAGIGDFDNDGYLDFLMGDYGDTWFYRNTGAGNSFVPAVSIDTADCVKSDFAEADYNNDGILDAVMGMQHNSIYVYKGIGDGTFSKSSFSAPSYIEGLDSGDFNGDGSADFVVANSNRYNVDIYRGRGDGTFLSPIPFTIGYKSYGVSAGDFNRDGKCDIIVSGILGSNVAKFWPGNGDGTFGSPTNLGFSATSMAESDVNNDGKLDLVYTEGFYIKRRLGNGDGTFSTSVSSVYIAGGELRGVATNPVTGGAEAREGDLLEYDVKFTDPGWLDTHTASISWGDGSLDSIILSEEHNQPDSTGTGSASHRYGDEGTRTITLRVDDDDGGFDTDIRTVKILNAPPVAAAGPDQTADEGGTVTFDGSGTIDPGYNDVLTYTWNFGDGSPLVGGVSLMAPTHVYDDEGVYTVTLSVSDGDGGVSSDTLRVTVSNVAPTVNAGPDQTVAGGYVVTFDGSSFDPGSDVLTYTWDFGDGSPAAGGVNLMRPTHAYAGNGTYVVTLTVSDGDGGVGSDAVKVNVDAIAPSTSIALSGTSGLNGWYTSGVTVTLTALDNVRGTGIDETYYSLDGVNYNTYTEPFTISSEGLNSLRYFSIDNVGNIEIALTLLIKIDKMAPTISGAATTSPNANGWYKTDVVVHFTANDDVSSIASLTPDTTLSMEAAGQSVTGIAVDNAGNSASFTVTGINIDRTPPSISGAPTTSANTHGWYRTDVAVHFEASDSLSGIETVTQDETLTVEGADQHVLGTAVDEAGNEASYEVVGINIDKTGPVISGSRSPGPNGFGWNNGDVTVRFETSDELSGVDPATDPADVALSAEGVDQSVTRSVSDTAGNTASATVSHISIDKTAPTISGSRTPEPNTYGWNNVDVTVHFDASDSLSGLDSVTPDQTLMEEGAGQSVTGTAADRAGNGASATISGISIDKTAPAVALALDRSPDSNEWYNHIVSFTLTSSDGLSGIACTSTPPSYSGPDSESITITASATDEAGNTASNSVAFKYDDTPPVITVNSPIGGSYALNQVVEAGYGYSDATSGPASCSGTVPCGGNIDTCSVLGNPHRFEVTATDEAGNRRTVTISYNVVYSLSMGRRILQPLEQVSSASQLREAYKIGSTLPIKFQLCDCTGAYMGTARATLTIYKQSSGVDYSDPVQIIDAGASNDNGNVFRYDETAQQYIYNFKTKGLTQGIYRIVISLDDGSTIVTYFQLRK